MARATHTGIIPALAGNTRQLVPAPGWLADHPRSRGEYGPAPPSVTTTPGSSPLSRGIPAGTTEAEIADRIIPALAGNTAHGPLDLRPHRDHPRSRGEYLPPALSWAPPMGSSPLSRGILNLIANSGNRVGIIPALAGNTIGILRLTCRYPGSSPLSRGILTDSDCQLTVPRIIPALAGNTGSVGSIPDAATDHPRSRGEYPRRGRRDCRLQGSSPLSRGIPARTPYGYLSRRIIPALAGNTPR